MSSNLEISTKNIFYEYYKNRDALLLNPVNTVGTMGSGFSKTLKEQIHDSYLCYRENYKEAFKDGKRILHDLKNRVVHVATKNHGKDTSSTGFIIDIVHQILDLIKTSKTSKYTYIYTPFIGTGLGGLKKEVVILLLNGLAYELEKYNVKLVLFTLNKNDLKYKDMIIEEVPIKGGV